PAVTPEAGLPTGFETLIQPDGALLIAPEDAPEARARALEAWLAAFSG
ncbi:MAG: thiamine ABC transporter substrate-binding protein, partial [Rhodobacteraceae bacterium]|nr:thiamine ABC transporter substrate-binding protein [Paracoccaceae bacterium]